MKKLILLLLFIPLVCIGQETFLKTHNNIIWTDGDETLLFRDLESINQLKSNQWNELNKKINQHLWSDAVYVKDWMTLEKLSENQLIIYAILANEVLKSPDLSHLVLQQIDKLKNSKYADAFLKSLTS